MTGGGGGGRAPGRWQRASGGQVRGGRGRLRGSLGRGLRSGPRRGVFGAGVPGPRCEAGGAGPHAARGRLGRGHPRGGGRRAAAASARLCGAVRRDEALLRLRGSPGAPGPSAGRGGEPRPQRPLGPAQRCWAIGGSGLVPARRRGLRPAAAIGNGVREPLPCEG